MGDRMTQELTAKALFGAVQLKRPPTGLIHHSDRGSQYCAENYLELVEQFGMRASMSRRGNCYDNAPIESFWGSLKTELVHDSNYAPRAEAEASIREYIEIFYNRQRRHSRLGYLCLPRSHKTSTFNGLLLEMRVSVIDRTPQPFDQVTLEVCRKLKAQILGNEGQN
jgi:transposase InsO family protein